MASIFYFLLLSMCWACWVTCMLRDTEWTVSWNMKRERLLKKQHSSEQLARDAEYK